MTGNGTTKTYTYDSSKKDRMTSFGGESCVYDSMGRPTTYRGKAVYWERGRFVSSIGSTTFKYDGEGKRTGKDTLIFKYDSDGRLCSQGCQYYGYNFMYDHTGLIGVKHETNYGNVSNTYFYRKNIFGDITAILDKDGKIVVKYVYDAWGNHKVLDASGNEITDPFAHW